MRIRGSMSHVETPARAAQRKETKGNAGTELPFPTSRMRLLFVPEDGGTLLFLRGRYEEGVGGAMMNEDVNDLPSTRRIKEYA